MEYETLLMEIADVTPMVDPDSMLIGSVEVELRLPRRTVTPASKSSRQPIACPAYRDIHGLDRTVVEARPHLELADLGPAADGERGVTTVAEQQLLQVGNRLAGTW